MRVVNFRPDAVNVLHGLQLPVAQASFIGHLLGSPQELVEPLMVMMKPLIGILFGLGREQEKRPITPLQKEELPDKLPQDSPAAVIRPLALLFEEAENTLGFL